MRPETRSFIHDGHRLVFDEYGAGERTVILTPGLLFSRKMHGPLASELAERGCRVLCLDLLGHGASDRPPEMSSYSMTIFGAQVIALMDHLEIERAVLGGTSLGANTTLEAVANDPDRVQGLLIEMPVLDNALLGCAIAFTPLMISLTFGAPVTRALSRVARLVPRRGPQIMSVGARANGDRGARLPLLGEMLLDWISQDPKPSASLLQGLFFGRTAPPGSERRGIEAPTLIIGHPRDPIHPFSDSDMLAHELPNARLIEASSILELRLSPERLTGEIARFVDDCWGGAAPAPSKSSRARGVGGANGSSASAAPRPRA